MNKWRQDYDNKAKITKEISYECLFTNHVWYPWKNEIGELTDSEVKDVSSEKGNVK